MNCARTSGLHRGLLRAGGSDQAATCTEKHNREDDQEEGVDASQRELTGGDHLEGKNIKRVVKKRARCGWPGPAKMMKRRSSGKVD